MQKIRVYGDNILECEEALRLITQSLEGEYAFTPSSLYAPQYIISQGGNTTYQVQLCPGYGRWLYDVQSEFRRRGALLREVPDAVITKIIRTPQGVEENPILALEFSGALPAGNNAWQRCGRAVGCAQAGVPYLYFAELGGVELDENRNIKAARFPNPIIPFAYFALGHSYDTFAMPVYQASPSITPEITQEFSDYFGGMEVAQVIRAIVEDQPSIPYIPLLKAKALGVTKILATRSTRGQNALTPAEWETIGNLQSGSARVNWFLQRSMAWRKTVIIPVTQTFTLLKQKVIELGACAVGTTDLPFCILPGTKRGDLANYMRILYPNKLSAEFLSWIEASQSPIVLVWIAGFKPAGDDSRPDRGLVPLARMILGENVDLLSIVYGPGRETMWRSFEAHMWQLAETNGLWQAVVSLSTGILVDTANASILSSYGAKVNTRPLIDPPTSSISDGTPLSPTQFGEHDVDSVLHMVFSVVGDEVFFEGLCNPPGGNWSGLSIFDRTSNQEVRWISLPRVSGTTQKRPDHVFQFTDQDKSDTILIVESKDRANTVESQIGDRLARYVENLLKHLPNIMRPNRTTPWSSLLPQYALPQVRYVTAAAFRYTAANEIQSVDGRAGVDITFAIEFHADGSVTLHVYARQVYEWLKSALDSAKRVFADWLIVQIH